MMVEQLGLTVLGPNPLVVDLLGESQFSCQVGEILWREGWVSLSQIALYHRSGPDVSEVGTTWLDSLTSAGAVRPFSSQEVDAFGGASVFVPALWKTTSLPSVSRKQVWAIPWLADVRVIFYWRDMLEQAGIDEETAFQTPEQAEETMERLQASDVKTPWGIWSDQSYMSLYNASTWVWQAGGDFLSADGKRILLDRPETLKGLQAFLRLHRYMPPDIRSMSVEASQGYNMFSNRRVAIAMGPCGWYEGIYNLASRDPDLFAKLGVAAPPGPAFVGGSNLIIWNHTRHLQEALDLVAFLTGEQVQRSYGAKTFRLPVRLDILNEPPYTTEPHYQVMVELLKTGRSYPVLHKWGAVEERLTQALAWLWNDLLDNPDQDIEALVNPYMESIARRLAVTLGTRE